jgi:hypothetical protein
MCGGGINLFFVKFFNYFFQIYNFSILGFFLGFNLGFRVWGFCTNLGNWLKWDHWVLGAFQDFGFPQFWVGLKFDPRGLGFSQFG